MALNDITNTLSGLSNSQAKLEVNPGLQSVKKRRSDGTFKVYKYEKYRKHLELLFDNEGEKSSFEEKFNVVKQELKCSVSKVLTKVLDHYLQRDTSVESNVPDTKITNESNGENCFKDETLFIGEVESMERFHVMFEEHTRSCPSAMTVTNISKTDHVMHMEYKCSAGHTRQWSSSSSASDNYIVNYKMYMAFVCSGVTSAQYERLCKFATFGTLRNRFRDRFLTSFSTIVDLLKKTSINDARREEKEASRKEGEDGICIMTDARHSCRKNSYHTDHVAIGQKTHKVVDIQHITKDDEMSSQKHEFVGCQRMYESFDQDGVKVVDHAHDRNTSINKLVRDRQQAHNSNDRWHVAKSVTKSFKIISCGAKKNSGKTWHPELSDKGKAIRNHVYWAMENCERDEEKLKAFLDSAITHFQNDHSNCQEDSSCRHPMYIPSWHVIQDPIAVDLLTKFIHGLVVYKSPTDFTFARDTLYIESFNNTCLLYLDKRIHYGNKMYELRSNIAVLDWNEHVDRTPSSVATPRLACDHDRRKKGKKIYKSKSYDFVDVIWTHILDTVRSHADEQLDLATQENSDSEEEDDGVM